MNGDDESSVRLSRAYDKKIMERLKLKDFGGFFIFGFWGFSRAFWDLLGFFEDFLGFCGIFISFFGIFGDRGDSRGFAGIRGDSRGFLGIFGDFLGFRC